jgi:hypothetical protein
MQSRTLTDGKLAEVRALLCAGFRVQDHLT